MSGSLYRTRDETGVPVCRRGHRLTKLNTYNRPGSTGNPQCRPCRSLMRVKYRKARQRTNARLVRLGTHTMNGEVMKKPVTADKCPRCSSKKVHGPRVVRFDQAPWCDCYDCGHSWQPPVKKKARR